MLEIKNSVIRAVESFDISRLNKANNKTKQNKQ